MENIDKYFADYLNDQLSDQQKHELDILLKAKPSLQTELNELKAFWDDMPASPSQESPMPMDEVFYAMLANEQALAQPENTSVINNLAIGLGNSKPLWPKVAKYAAVLAGLVLCFWLGRQSADQQEVATKTIVVEKPVYITKYIPQADTKVTLPQAATLANNSPIPTIKTPETNTVINELGAIRKEMQETKELMMLTMLKRESASDRIQALNYSYDLQKPDVRILNALVYTLDHDNNINVRMAAAEAISRFGNEEIVRNSLVNSLLKQQEPTLQIAVIDLLTTLKERRAMSVLQTLANNEDTSEYVKKRAEESLKRLSI
jgi:hypothetical protein